MLIVHLRAINAVLLMKELDYSVRDIQVDPELELDLSTTLRKDQSIDACSDRYMKSTIDQYFQFIDSLRR